MMVLKEGPDQPVHDMHRLISAFVNRTIAGTPFLSLRLVW